MQLREEFEPYGEVVFAKVNLDRETGRSKGFGFVEFANEEDAVRAQREMDGKEVKGRNIKVDFAKEDPNKMYKKPEGEGYASETRPTVATQTVEAEPEAREEDETIVDENVF